MNPAIDLVDYLCHVEPQTLAEARVHFAANEIANARTERDATGRAGPPLISPHNLAELHVMFQMWGRLRGREAWRVFVRRLAEWSRYRALLGHPLPLDLQDDIAARVEVEGWTTDDLDPHVLHVTVLERRVH